jgi:uncharacterized protein (DUF779 family)
MSISVDASPEAEALAARVREEHAGATIAFVVDDGCCENSGLQLQQLWWRDPRSLEVGAIGGVPIYCPENVARILGDSTIHVKVVSSDDMVDSFSLETALGCRFSTLITPTGRDGG